MFFHQVHNSIGGEIFNAFVYRDIKWYTHLHRGFELCFNLSGKIKATAGDKEYTLTRGDVLLLTPYQLHSYESQGHSLAYVVVFSGGFADSFNRFVSGKEAVNALLTPSEETKSFFIKNMLNGFDAALAENSDSESIEINKPPVFTIKACLYAVFAEYINSTQFVEKPLCNKLIFDILDYIEKNYASDISLYKMADALGYDFRYISRIFGKTFGINFKTLVNQYRCDRAKSLISSTDDTLSDIAMNSGFQSLRSFNRVFLSLTGYAPSEIRKTPR